MWHSVVPLSLDNPPCRIDVARGDDTVITSLRRATSSVAFVLVTTGAGLLVVGIADRQARATSALASLPVFWAGISLVAIPAMWRLLSRTAARSQRVVIVLVLGLALYLVKVMASPVMLTLPDEFSHLRTLNDILRTGHPFSPNPLLEVSTFYPGLEVLTAAIRVSTGLDAVTLAIVEMAVARVIAVLSLFHIAETIAGSARVAGIASVVYMGNLSFVTFDAQFSYESLALPLALLALWAVLAWSRHGGRSPIHALLALGAIGTVTMTHHLTSLALLTVLVGWAILSAFRRPPRGARWPVFAAAAWAAATNVTWFAAVGGVAIGYLRIIILSGVAELISVLNGKLPAKQLFAGRPEFALPLPEMAVAYGAVLLLVAALPFMLIHAIRSRPVSAMVLLLAIGAIAYPGTLALRFTVTGSETSQRAAEFLFLPLGVLGADWVVGTRTTWWRPRSRPLLLAVLAVIFAGGIVSGDPPQGRLPGPYYVAAEQLSIEPQGIAAAQWGLSALGPDNRIIADRTNAKLMGSIGSQFPVTSAYQHLGTAYVMFNETLTPDDLDVLQKGHIRYVVVDLRMSRATPVYKYYFESAEPDAGRHITPFPIAGLEKFDHLVGVTRIYDSGDIVIYDVGGLAGDG